MKKVIVLFCLVSSFSTLTNESANLGWREIQFGLWSSKTGELGIKTRRAVGDQLFEDAFITTIGTAGDGSEPKFSEVIDQWTFRQIGTQLYQDTHRVYYHRVHSDGGFFYPIDVDVSTFQPLGECYAKDKSSIYYVSGPAGVGKMDADYDI